jgi:hypothetical protein
MLCRTIIINFIYLEIFTYSIKLYVRQISTGRGGAPTTGRQRWCADAKFSAAVPAKLGGGVTGAASWSLNTVLKGRSNHTSKTANIKFVNTRIVLHVIYGTALSLTPK